MKENIYTVQVYGHEPVNSVHEYKLLKIVNKRAKTLRRTNPVLEEEPEPLDIRAIRHPVGKFRRISVRVVEDLAGLSRRRNIISRAPAKVLLVFVTQDVVEQQLCTLGVRCVLENGASLGPGYELAFGGEQEFGAR